MVQDLSNNELIELFINNLTQLDELFQQHALIEMNRDTILVH
jgi:predicted nuclease of predicted toxin-antitoxin system